MKVKNIIEHRLGLIVQRVLYFGGFSVFMLLIIGDYQFSDNALFAGLLLWIAPNFLIYYMRKPSEDGGLANLTTGSVEKCHDCGYNRII